jgi:hypothetical protein
VGGSDPSPLRRLVRTALTHTHPRRVGSGRIAAHFFGFRVASDVPSAKALPTTVPHPQGLTGSYHP